MRTKQGTVPNQGAGRTRARHWSRAWGWVLLSPGWAVWAQAPTAPVVERVEVRSSPEAQRRDDVAGRQVVGRTELLSHGQSSLADALRRVPGLTVEGRGTGVEVKLGGLGQGYTQLMLNGDPLPRGFALESIPLDSIERIEIVRGGSVQSSQAIAGSVNIVTRRPPALATRDLKLNAGSQSGHPLLLASMNLGDRWGQAQWGLGLVLSHDDWHWPATYVQERSEGEQGVVQRVRTHKLETSLDRAVSLNPRWSWKDEAADGSQWQLSTDHSLRHAWTDDFVHDVRQAVLGAPPAQAQSDMDMHFKTTVWRGKLQAKRREADGASTEARLTTTWSRRLQHAQLLGRDVTLRPVQDQVVDGQADDQSLILAVNHQRDLGAAHRLDMGAELEQARRRESRVQDGRELPLAPPPQDLDERYDAVVQRRALYLQDDWTVSPGTAAQWGLRLEQLNTDSSGNVFETVRQSHRLIGPLARVSIKPEGGWGVFKLGLTRGFKLPEPREVMPRRFTPIEVSATAPAMTGNPLLRPERAWSLDASWQGGDAASNWVLAGALRRIDDVILDQLSYRPNDPNYTWLLERFNGGRAWSANVELEWSGQRKQGLVEGQPLRWKTSVALFESRLDALADKPNPTIAGQAPWQIKLNATQSLTPTLSTTWALQARGATLADQPNERSLALSARYGLDLSLAWQPRPRQSWTLSVSRLGAPDDEAIKTTRVASATGPIDYRAQETWHQAPRWRLGFESDF